MYTNFFFTCSLAFLLLHACSPKNTLSTSAVKPSTNYKHPITYQPQQYVCYKANNPLIIDGKLTEKDWELAAPTNNFVDIEGALKPLPTLPTYAKILWDKEYLLSLIHI